MSSFMVFDFLAGKIICRYSYAQKSGFYSRIKVLKNGCGVQKSIYRGEMKNQKNVFWG